jgi:hypothetical protein
MQIRRHRKPQGILGKREEKVEIVKAEIREIRI